MCIQCIKVHSLCVKIHVVQGTLSLFVDSIAQSHPSLFDIVQGPWMKCMKTMYNLA